MQSWEIWSFHFSFCLSLSSPDHCPAPITARVLSEETRSTSNATKPCCVPSRQSYKGNISWTSALMRANFLSKHLKRGGAFSCHPLPGLMLLSSSLWLEIKTRAFASFNERWQWLQHFRRELGKEGWLQSLSPQSLIHQPFCPGQRAGSKATYLLLSTKSPRTPLWRSCPALEITALKGSVTQGFASLGRMGQEGKDDPVELLDVIARSAKAGFWEC